VIKYWEGYNLGDKVFIFETWKPCKDLVGMKGYIVMMYKPGLQAVQIFVRLEGTGELQANGRLTELAVKIECCLCQHPNYTGSEWMDKAQTEHGLLLRCTTGHLSKMPFEGGAWEKLKIGNIGEGTRVTLMSSWPTLDPLVGKSGVVVALRFVTHKDSKYKGENMMLVLLDDDSLQTQRLVNNYSLREEWQKDPGMQWLQNWYEKKMVIIQKCLRRPMLCLDSHVVNEAEAQEAAVTKKPKN
jgi:hypothetical protein